MAFFPHLLLRSIPRRRAVGGLFAGTVSIAAAATHAAAADDVAAPAAPPAARLRQLPGESRGKAQLREAVESGYLAAIVVRARSIAHASVGRGACPRFSASPAH
jgi:hypothetical protein